MRKEEGNESVPLHYFFIWCKYKVISVYAPNFSLPNSLHKWKRLVKYSPENIEFDLKQYFYIMNIIRLAGELFLLYILYKLIFDFIIPIYQTTKKVKKQFGEMHNKMQDQMNKFNQQQNPVKKPTTQEPAKKEDYIDYEEIKK
ncbi:MAG: hypothetical protein ABJA71_17600 [Ginsengibacter sp.]